LVFIELPLDGEGLAEKIAAGARVLRLRPTSYVIARYSIFLALGGRDDEARALLWRALHTCTNERHLLANLIMYSPPEAQAVLDPVFRDLAQR
jgi:hypothetical protein